MTNPAETKEKVILDAIEYLISQLNRKMEKIEEDIKKIEGDINEIKIGQASIKSELEGNKNELKAEISQLDKRLGNLETRINTQTNLFLIIISVFVPGILALFSKVVFFSHSLT